MGDMVQFRLCKRLFPITEMSEEHYPARCVGNTDIVGVDIIKLVDQLQSTEMRDYIIQSMENGNSDEQAIGDYFDEKVAKSLYPKGRTAQTLCRECNTFLGNYDKCYLRFFNENGNPKAIKGFQKATKIKIIKSIFAKFLSVPEAENEAFDFIDFIKNENAERYDGLWKLYFVRRDFSSDIFGMPDIGTGRAEFEEGIVYELSDEKFIFSLPEEKGDTFEVLSEDIRAALEKDQPSLVLDRLHTFSTKLIRDICQKHSIPIAQNNSNYPLHSLVGALVSYYKANDVLESEFTEQAIKMSISIFERFNSIRNDHSYAHDNDILNKIEARYVVKVISAAISLLYEIESTLF